MQNQFFSNNNYNSNSNHFKEINKLCCSEKLRLTEKKVIILFRPLFFDDKYDFNWKCLKIYLKKLYF